MTRRDIITRMLGITSVIVAVPNYAEACLYGKWNVRCPNGHIDTVTDGTCQHKCEKCRAQVFSGKDVTVVCRNGHSSRITTGDCGRSTCTTSYICPKCGIDCRLD